MTDAPPSMANLDLTKLERDLAEPPPEKYVPAKYRAEPTLSSMVEDLRKLKRDTTAAIDETIRKLEEYRSELTRRLG